MTGPIPATVTIRESMAGVLKVVIAAPPGRQIAIQGMPPSEVRAYPPGPSSMLTLTVQTQR
jgi:hypothetical protein